jgi:hypothetical protein
MLGKRLLAIAMFAAIAMVAAACSSSDSTATPTTVAPASDTTKAAGTTPTTNTPDTTATTQAPTTTAAALEASCDWDTPRLSNGDTSSTPTSGAGDVAQAMLGSWQHTYIDSGSGFEALDTTRDIRYVLADGRFLYCQDVEGATDQAENSAPLKVEGAMIVLPSPATGYEVVAWNEDMMVWRNLRDDSLYLLERR